MSPPTTAPSLLEELDARQNEVLQQLDELNRRIEDLLRQHGARVAPPSVEAPPVLADEATRETSREIDQAA